MATVKVSVAVGVGLFVTITTIEVLPSVEPLEANAVAVIVVGPPGTVVVSQLKVEGGVDPKSTPLIETLTNATLPELVTVIGTVPETVAPLAGVTIATKGEVVASTGQLQTPPPLPLLTMAPHCATR